MFDGIEPRPQSPLALRVSERDYYDAGYVASSVVHELGHTYRLGDEYEDSSNDGVDPGDSKDQRFDIEEFDNVQLKVDALDLGQAAKPVVLEQVKWNVGRASKASVITAVRRVGPSTLMVRIDGNVHKVWKQFERVHVRTSYATPRALAANDVVDPKVVRIRDFEYEVNDIIGDELMLFAPNGGATDADLPDLHVLYVAIEDDTGPLHLIDRAVEAYLTAPNAPHGVFPRANAGCRADNAAANPPNVPAFPPMTVPSDLIGLDRRRGLFRVRCAPSGRSLQDAIGRRSRCGRRSPRTRSRSSSTALSASSSSPTRSIRRSYRTCSPPTKRVTDVGARLVRAAGDRDQRRARGSDRRVDDRRGLSRDGGRAGLGFDTPPAPLAALSAPALAVAHAAGALGDAPTPEAVEVLRGAVRDFVDQLQSLQASAFPAELAELAETFAAEALTHSVLEYLFREHRLVYHALRVLAIVRVEYVPATSARGGRIRRKIIWDNVAQLVSDLCHCISRGVRLGHALVRWRRISRGRSGPAVLARLARGARAASAADCRCSDGELERADREHRPDVAVVLPRAGGRDCDGRAPGDVAAWGARRGCPASRCCRSRPRDSMQRSLSTITSISSSAGRSILQGGIGVKLTPEQGVTLVLGLADPSSASAGAGTVAAAIDVHVSCKAAGHAALRRWDGDARDDGDWACGGERRHARRSRALRRARAQGRDVRVRCRRRRPPRKPGPGEREQRVLDRGRLLVHARVLPARR